MNSLHQPVLLQEILEVFRGNPLRFFFDGTLGAGGHAEALLKEHPELECYVGCDRDPQALALARERLLPWKDRIRLVHGSYADVDRLLEGQNIACIDGFLIDVGVSSMQLDQGERGFSFRHEALLDMRMNPEQELTASWVVNRYSEKDLARILFEYGQERRSRQIAKAIVEARRKKKIETTGDLAKLLLKVGTKGKLHPATLTFQALRIEVNDELGQLERGLQSAIEKTRSGGRLAVISFHSLEDGKVKHLFRENKEKLSLLTKKPLEPSLMEKRKNPRSRSAKLRAAEKR